MSLNTIITLLKYGIDQQFLDLDQTVWIGDQDLYWQGTVPAEGFQDIQASDLRTLISHNVFIGIGDGWYCVHPDMVQTLYDQMNRHR